MKCRWYLCENKARPSGVFCSSKCSGKAAVTRKRQAIKVKAVEYKGGECFRCGYSKSVKALQFHHIEPHKKDFGVSTKGFTRSWEKLKVELDKCNLVCSNCHAEIHEEEYEEKIGASLELTGRITREIGFCEDCGKELAYHSRKKTNKCRKCFMSSVSKIKDSREIVKQKVSESNINRVAKHYGVSFNAVKKYISK